MFKIDKLFWNKLVVLTITTVKSSFLGETFANDEDDLIKNKSRERYHTVNIARFRTFRRSPQRCANSL